MNEDFEIGGMILNYDFRSKRHTRCSQCIHADYNKMKCYPKSNDCKSEYNLTEEDFHKESRCDFFQKK